MPNHSLAINKSSMKQSSDGGNIAFLKSWDTLMFQYFCFLENMTSTKIISNFKPPVFFVFVHREVTRTTSEDHFSNRRVVPVLGYHPLERSRSTGNDKLHLC